MPHKGHLIAVTALDKGAIIDIKNKKYVRTVPKWGGTCTLDGKYGLYAPQRYQIKKKCDKHIGISLIYILYYY